MNLLVSETIHTHGPLSANDIVLLAAYASRMENHGEDTNQTIDDALALGVKIKVLKDGPSPGGKLAADIVLTQPNLSTIV
ncbi:hypothetical protein M404DRAFT_36638 [Pisolithus tinctorius Marx 270]|uniref:Uncharacterized protein n=1 Tax=Pisolithus tinctorius Marx 270 TaxID=870435 RepID=A0A0C3MVE1_PISTI|nr:hypothetical protein M404DRAFT_36638 [Pisolithus tinctorius Marx 270]